MSDIRFKSLQFIQAGLNSSIWNHFKKDTEALQKREAMSLQIIREIGDLDAEMFGDEYERRILKEWENEVE